MVRCQDMFGNQQFAELEEQQPPQGVPKHKGSCPTCRRGVPVEASSLSVNTGLRARVAALLGDELAVRVYAEKAALRNTTAGEKDGAHDKGYDIVNPINEERWTTIRGKTKRFGAITARRSIVLDDQDQRVQLALALWSNEPDSPTVRRLGNPGLQVSICLLTMEEDEADDGGFPLILNNEDDEHLVTKEERFYSSVDVTGISVATEGEERQAGAEHVNIPVPVTRRTLRSEGMVQFEIDTSTRELHMSVPWGAAYDFHGECDLILLQSKDFESGMGGDLGMDVHIRTQMRGDMSYICGAVLRIGSDILEVESKGVYYLNGVASAELPNEFSGFKFLHKKPTDKQHVFEVHLGGLEVIKVKTYKDFVSVLIEQGGSKHFGDSVGLMGDFAYGVKLSRNGKNVMSDVNAFGQEWQVLDTDPTLFQTARFPQFPQKCIMPSSHATSMLRRRLSESSPDQLAAEKACAHWGTGKDDCIFDVLATGDLEMAEAGEY